MKKTILFLCSLAVLAACQEKINATFIDDVVETKILIDRNVLVKTMPMTKAGQGKIYYAVEIDSISTENGKTTYQRYAEGVFTDPQKMNVRLDKNRRYAFRCAVVEDGNDKLYSDGGYLFTPFTDSGNKKVKITDEFVYTASAVMDLDNGCGTIKVNDGEDKVNAEVHRYYGEFIDSAPRNTNATVTIPVSRRNFGLLFNITPPDEGQIHVYQNYGSPKFDYVVKSDGEQVYDERVFALDLVNDFQTVYLKVEWIRGNGDIIDYSPASFKAYNATMTVVDVNLVSYTTTNSLSVSIDSGMTENTITIR